MQVLPLTRPDMRRVPSAQPGVEPRVAVLLNAHARKVGPKVVRALSHVVPDEDLFLSRSLLDCKRIVQLVLERGYTTVFTGGGDGTFMGFVNELLRQTDVRGRHPGAPMPRVGVLKLGTGNALATFVNASASGRQGFLDDVLRARAGEVPGSRRLDLLLADGQRTPFAGLGVDGKVLNDFLTVKDTLGRGALKKVMSGSMGYFSAVAFKTVPHYLTNSTLVEAEVHAGAHPAFRLGPDGRPVGEPVAPGGLLFRGRIMMAAAATMPFYGYGLKMFPFAGQRRSHMHLRLGQVHPAAVIANLPKLWTGRWFPEGLLDFHAQDVTVKFDRPMPFQVGGDAAGYKDVVHLSVAPESVELVDFNAAVH